MSSMNINPVGKGVLPQQPTSTVKHPIREVLGLSESANDVQLRERVVIFFVASYISNLDLLYKALHPSECSVDIEAMKNKLYEVAEELIKTKYTYARKNMDKDIENAKQRLGLPSSTSNGEVYFEQVVNELKYASSGIIGVDYKIPETAESLSTLQKEVSDAFWKILAERYTKLGNKPPENIREDFFNTYLHSTIRKIHGYDPNDTKIIARSALSLLD